MNDYSAEGIIRDRRRRQRRENTRDDRRQKEIAYYLLYATIPRTARELERLNFPTDIAPYNDINETLTVPGSTRQRTGWRLATITWRGGNWNLYILQHGVLVMQSIDHPQRSKIVPRSELRRYVTRFEDATSTLWRLRSLGNILVNGHLKLQWYDYPGFWFCTY